MGSWLYKMTRTMPLKDIMYRISRILVVLQLVLVTWTVTGQDEQCGYAIGDYRDCTCGVQYRIVEQRCCTSETCTQPNVTSENITCPFMCQNGGNVVTQSRRCECTQGYYGLCCERETPLCGDVFLEDSGNFTSLDFPNLYPRNTECIWHISTDPERRIALGVKDNEFDLEKGSSRRSCNHDYIEVLDGANANSPVIKRFCGDKYCPRTFHTVYSTGSHLYVHFKTDYIVQRKGFHLEYSVFFAGQECGPYSRYTLSRGTITSPQYPLSYRPNENCEWTIHLLQDHDLVLTFETIDLPAMPGCGYDDYLLVTGVGNDGKETGLTTFCGKDASFEPYTIPRGRYEDVLISFRSNRFRQGKGFVLNYQQIPN